MAEVDSILSALLKQCGFTSDCGLASIFTSEFYLWRMLRVIKWVHFVASLF